jgi:HK97 family phage prohead protease
MPLKRCEADGQPGWKWGDAGKCYVHMAGDEESEQAARKKAMAQAAAMGEFPGTGDRSNEVAPPNAPLESRESVLAGVNFKQRLIDLLAVPYDQEADIEYRGELWRERFSRGAFDGIEDHAGRVRVNRGHNRDRTIGKVVQFLPSHEDGLMSRVRIASTPLGDETLALADEDMLSPSITFAVRGRDQLLDRRSRVRVINRAFIDHIAMVEDPAYRGAKVLAVREGLPAQPVASEPLVTLALDEYLGDDILSWAKSRLGK